VSNAVSSRARGATETTGRVGALVERKKTRMKEMKSEHLVAKERYTRCVILRTRGDGNDRTRRRPSKVRKE
jgi:hypothetical protein